MENPKIKWWVVLFWLIVCWPVVIVYVIMVENKRKHIEMIKAIKKSR